MTYTSTKKQREKDFQEVFLSHRWGNASNSGKGKGGNYKRPYNKTKREEEKGE